MRLKHLVLGLACCSIAGGEAQADQTVAAKPVIRQIQTAAPVEDVLLLPDGAFIQTDEGYAKLVSCGSTGVCAETVGRVMRRRPTPMGGLPDGRIAERGQGDVAEAWYASPTRRYEHGVLGDEFEAAKLIVKTRNGEALEAELPPDAVFEDLTPRLADLDGDGSVEIVTIRSDTLAGARLSIWGVIGDALVERAASEPVGQPKRWLNPLPLIDGAPVLAVVTPHLGGPLLQWSFADGELAPKQRLGGDRLFSNHAIGSRDLSLAVRDGERWAVPLAGRKNIVVGDGGDVVAELPLDFTISDDMALVGGNLVVRSPKGALYAIKAPWQETLPFRRNAFENRP